MTSKKDDKVKLQEQLKELKAIQSDTDNQLDMKDRDVEFYFTEIAPIQIYISSNVPGKEPWILKRSNFATQLARPSFARKITDYSELPYFTNEVEYPTKSLYKMEPYEIYDFFFSREFFEYKLNYIIFQKNRGKKPPLEPDTKRREEYNHNNIMTMLQLLFTTVYPRTNNITNSVDEYLRKQSNSLNLSRIMSKSTYTYMKMDGQEYTVMKAIWLNDLFNHPKYNQLADRYIEYKYWCITQSKSIQKKIDDNIQKIENSIVGFDFTELVGILEKKQTNIQRTVSFEQEVFQTNLDSFRKIVNIMSAYRMFILGGKRNANAFISEANQYSTDFNPYDGQPVEVCLREFADKDTVYKDYWYHGKIVEKDGGKYKVDIWYINKDLPNTKSSLRISVSKDNIREPILPKIIELKLDKTGMEIQKMIINDTMKGIDFGPNRSIDGKFFYKNINSIGQTRNKNIFEIKPEVDLAEYKNTPELYRYKIPDDTYTRIEQQIKRQSGKPPTDIFIGYLDILEETYTKVKSSLNFNSRIKGFIEGMIRLHKIILPIKAINDLYLNTYKIDIQNKDIATKETASELTPYNEFANFITGYLGPKMVSANTDLQSFIQSYAENIAGDNFITLMDLLETCYSDKKPKCRVIRTPQKNEAVLRYINTSVNYINLNDKTKPQYEIYVQVNMVKGHMDNTNWATIKCDYNDTILSDKFNTIFNTKQVVGDWMVTPGPFVDIGNAGPPAPAAPPKKGVAAPNKTKKTGGKKRRGSRRRRRS